MKNYGSCLNCGTITNLYQNLCKACDHEERSNVKIIKEFLSIHPKSNAMEISTETGIAINKITRLVKKGFFK